MKKKHINFMIFSLIYMVLSAFFSPLCFAEEAKDTALTLTLETAIGRIESDNPDIKALDSKIVVAKKQYDDDSKKQNKASIKDPMGKTTVLDIKKQQEINWRESLLNLKNMEHQRKETLRNLKVEAEKMYIEASALKSDIQNSKDELSVIDKRIDEANLKIKLGYVKQSDIKTLEAQKSQISSTITASQNSLSDTMADLKGILGISDDTALYIDPLYYDMLEFDDSNIEGKIQEAVKMSYDISSKQEELDILNLDKTLTLKYSLVKDDSTVDSINSNIADKEEEFESAGYNLRSSLLSSYYNLKVLQNNVEAEKLNVETAENDLKNTHALVNAGIAVKIDELEKSNALSKEKSTLQRAINSYIIASHDLKGKLEIDIPQE